MIKFLGKRTLVFLAKTVDYPEGGSESIPKYLNLTPFLNRADRFGNITPPFLIGKEPFHLLF
jgi:hypothetical protein